jgi:hypothetical protein
MRNWKFWGKPTTEQAVDAPEDGPPGEFGIYPRTDLPGLGMDLDPEQLSRLEALRRQRETVLFDVEQAERASQDDNPWRSRIAHLDDALTTVRGEMERAGGQLEPVGQPFPNLPIHSLTASVGPPPSVSFKIGDNVFLYEEEQDWAERGTQIARGELILVLGTAASVIVDERTSPDFRVRVEQLAASLFVFASDVRDRVVEGASLPSGVTVADLAAPDQEHGGWVDWKGHSSAKARLDSLRAELRAEEQRLLDARAQELDDLANWKERLPIARKRLADVDAQIAAVEGS